MKRTLAIVIDANRVTCGKCEHVDGWSRYDGQSQCAIFRGEVLRYTRGHWWRKDRIVRRCAPCLAAEREARK